MRPLTINSLQWSTLLDIDDVKPIDESDSVCLEEIRDVLERHDRLDRFGVTLLHKHFDLGDDEILLETTDVGQREHWIRPVSQSALRDAGIEARTTMVSFDKDGYRQVCVCSQDNSGHTGGHASTL